MVFDPGSHDIATVNVPLAERSYDIHIQTNGQSQFSQTVSETLDDLSHALVITDEAVADSWAQPAIDSLQQIGVRVSTFNVPSGESSKSIAQLSDLWNWMLAENADRRSVVFAVGGGVIGDLAGFAAASFTRGIRFVQLPTTLLAMVDSSVGGKTGINLPTAKNMVGAFWQPEMVWIDTDVLSTLSDRSYLSGLAEVIKYGVIDDDAFFAWLTKNAKRLVERDNEAMRVAIAASCKSKASVVGEDERETSGRRAILNYGHTFAHAIEATVGYGTLLHGEAVSIGMQMAARLGIELKLCDQDLLEQQTKLIEACQLPTTLPSADPSEMLPVMQRDKKVAHGKLRFILPTRIGAVGMVSDVDEAAIVRAIEATR